MPNYYKVQFLKKYVVKRKTNLSNPYSVLEACCNLAYADMLTGGKYFLRKNNKGNKNKKKIIVDSFLEKIKEYKYAFSRQLIDEMLPDFGRDIKITTEKAKKKGKGKYEDWAHTYGLCQKFVNMCFKYFFVFKDEMKKTIRFNFKNCDCPLDSVIIKSLKGGTVWTKLDKNEYESLQTIIDNELNKQVLPKELKNIGRLAYDFMNW